MSDLPAETQVVPATRAVEKDASATTFDACRAFHSNGTETVTVTFKDGATVDLSVTEGAVYPYSITAYTTGTQTMVVLY